ncbi:MAG: hypothetical protein M3O66_03120 [Verrucomicrobiota bacterium]|nr:hypothetical protein [Verrucomicrobiota bacterium]
MKLNTLFSLIAAGTLAFSSAAFAASATTYQVTGPVVEANDSMIVVMKGKERFEINRDSSTKVTGDLKVGEKVTIMYTMTAKEVEVKAGKAEKGAKKEAAAKPSASPSASPKK